MTMLGTCGVHARWSNSLVARLSPSGTPKVERPCLRSALSARDRAREKFYDESPRQDPDYRR
jgi:hypothetical protein